MKSLKPLLTAIQSERATIAASRAAEQKAFRKMRAISKEVGAIVRKLRKEHGVPQKKVAKAIGLTQGTLCQMEQGKGKMVWSAKWAKAALMCIADGQREKKQKAAEKRRQLIARMEERKRARKEAARKLKLKELEQS